MKFSLFLRNAKAASVEARQKIYVLGNEAGDLDSFVSSLSLAYLENLKAASSAYIPLLNIDRQDLPLRGEIRWAFDRFGVDTSSLVFISDFDIQLQRDSNIILVDHNTLSVSQSYLKDRVIGIFDHHRDEKQYLDVSPRVIQPVGSCCSLIMAEWLKSGLIDQLPEELSNLMLCTILIDTINLQESLGRTTIADREAAKKLMIMLKMDSIMAQHLLNQLQDAKNDLMHLSSQELMRKDHKKWTMSGISLGISSITWSISEWRNRELRNGGSQDWMNALDSFMFTNSIDILCVMTAFEKDGVFNRELFIIIDSTKLSPQKLIEDLMKSELDLEIIDSDSKGAAGNKSSQ